MILAFGNEICDSIVREKNTIIHVWMAHNMIEEKQLIKFYTFSFSVKCDKLKWIQNSLQIVQFKKRQAKQQRKKSLPNESTTQVE